MPETKEVVVESTVAIGQMPIGLILVGITAGVALGSAIAAMAKSESEVDRIYRKVSLHNYHNRQSRRAR